VLLPEIERQKKQGKEVARKHRELQKKIRIQMPSTVPIPDPACVTRRPRAYAGGNGGGEESMANTRSLA